MPSADGYEYSRTGQSFERWLAAAGADLLAGRRDRMPTYVEYLRDFVADDQGCVEIHSFVGPASKVPVVLPEPMRVPVEEIPRIEAALLAGDQPHVDFQWRE